MELKEILYLLEKDHPNDMEFGKKVRSLVNKMKEAQSREVNQEQLKGQINIFGEVKK